MLSIIIPAYNAESYLAKCVQGFTNLAIDHEILIINDGSIDNTEKIALNLCSHNLNISYFYKENGGLSSARNFGLEKALGDYIWFVDSDDTVNLLDFNAIYQDFIASQSDLMIFGLSVYFLETKDIIEHAGFNYQGEINEDVIHEVLKKGLFNYAWNKIYSKEFIVRNKILFNLHSVPSEDFEFNCIFMHYKPQVYVTEKKFYNYLRRPGDSLVSKYQKNLERSLKNKHQSFALLKDSLEDKDYLSVEEAEMRICEIENYVINLYRDKCELGKNEKINKIKCFVYDQESKKLIKKAKGKYLFTKIFKKIYLVNSPILVHYSYILFTKSKSRFSKLHAKFRGK